MEISIVPMGHPKNKYRQANERRHIRRRGWACTRLDSDYSCDALGVHGSNLKRVNSRLRMADKDSAH